jgi:Integrase zinc binding domain
MHLLPDHLFLKKTYLKDDPEIRREVVKELHDTPAAGYPRISNTWELVRQHYKGSRLQQFVENYIKGCPKCQETKTNIHQMKAPLQPLDTAVEKGPFQLILMDLITDLPKSDGFDSILNHCGSRVLQGSKVHPMSQNHRWTRHSQQVPETPCALVWSPRMNHI